MRLTVADFSTELGESDRWVQPDMRATQSAVFYPSPPEYDLRDGYFSDHEARLGRLTKRRKSGESSFNTFANRIVARLPSLSKRNRGTKSPSSLDLEDEGELHSPYNALSRSTSRTSHRLPSGSNSRAGSLRRRTNELEMEKPEIPRAPTQIETIAEDEPRDGPHSPMDMLNDSDIVNAHPESQERASTPLLPPLMVEPQYTIPIQSPLQSPAVAAHSGAASSSDSPARMSHVSSMTSLPLSAEPSSSSVHRSRATTIVPVSEIPPVPITDSNDEWGNILGHNNFHIFPEPYIPEHCNSQSCNQLLSDWQKARLEYAKHRARTSTHFGHTSKTYRLTEDKWADIDARWKRNNEIAALKAVKNGETLPGQPMMEPAPVAMIPSINGSGDGKFPTLGDEDIVGPMVQVPPQLQRRPSKKAQLLKMLGGITRPGATRNRASSSHQ